MGELLKLKCPACGGSGFTPDFANLCVSCNGTGCSKDLDSDDSELCPYGIPLKGEENDA